MAEMMTIYDFCHQEKKFRSGLFVAQVRLITGLGKVLKFPVIDVGIMHRVVKEAICRAEKGVKKGERSN